MLKIQLVIKFLPQKVKLSPPPFFSSTFQSALNAVHCKNLARCAMGFGGLKWAQIGIDWDGGVGV
jgi:hypothetical protein